MNLVQECADFVCRSLQDVEPGHDWGHVSRVRKIAHYIAEKEGGANILVVELAALLHDMNDWKFNRDLMQSNSKTAREWLKHKAEQDVIDHVCSIIDHVSFKGSHVPDSVVSKEGQIVQDADRLDALGAIGIARAFSYGGHKKQEMFNPDLAPNKHESFDEYRRARTTTVNHFHEKLFLLKERMHTQTARQIAEERHRYMERFLAQFMCEWDATDLELNISRLQARDVQSLGNE